MREDMAKVLVERPRRGRHGVRKGRLPRDAESLPAFIGLRRQVQERGETKDLNENLAPLRRYLERQLGRPWNKVYGEMRARIDAGNTVQAHVLAHVDQFISLRVVKTAPSQNAPCGLTYQGWGWRGGLLPLRERELYVDPDDGLIKRARRRVARRLRAERAAAGPIVHALAAEQAAVRIDDVWYGVRLRRYALGRSAIDLPRAPAHLAFTVEGRRYAAWTDPILGPVQPSDGAKLRDIAALYGADRLADAKRQLSRRDLTRHGLRNEPVG